MHRQYHIFEIYADHSLKWHASVTGKERALENLKALSRKTLNECFVMEIATTREIIARMNLGPSLMVIRQDDAATVN